ncbi:hypothetical protein PENSPDRAFT_654881, partial [Peniophora sp. CONT]
MNPKQYLYTQAYPAPSGAMKRRLEDSQDDSRRVRIKRSHRRAVGCTTADGCPCRDEDMRFVLPSSSKTLLSPLDQNGVGELMLSIEGGSSECRCVSCGRAMALDINVAMRIYRCHSRMIPGGLPRREAEFGENVVLVPLQSSSSASSSGRGFEKSGVEAMTDAASVIDAVRIDGIADVSSEEEVIETATVRNATASVEVAPVFEARATETSVAEQTLKGLGISASDSDCHQPVDNGMCFCIVFM